MTANSSGSFIASLFIFLCLFCHACQTESALPQNLSFVPTKLALHNNDQMVSIGTSYNESSIRYPAIQIQNDEPIIFPSKTSARGLLLKTNQSGQSFISYYQAKDLEHQEEVSRLFSLNNNFELKDNISYGHRTRLVDFIPSSSQQFICLNYEREFANISVAWIENNELNKKVSFTVGEETTIPKQIIQSENGDLLILGVADGFEFKDGHSYKEAFSKGFILLTDNKGVEKKRWIKAANDGHVFFENVQIQSSQIYISGSIQQVNTGMDAFFITLDNQLNPLNEMLFTQNNHQEILDVELNEKSTTLFINSFDDTDNYQLLIKELSYQGNLIKENKIDSLQVSSIKDVATINKQIYVLTHNQKSRTAIPNTSILKFDRLTLSN